MPVLTAVMATCALVALLLGVAGRRRIGLGPVLGEVVMLGAVLDAHLPGLGIVPAPFWAVVLGSCAMVTALLDRLRRGGPRVGGDHLHALGMLLGAVFVLLADGTHHDAGAHPHAGGLVVPILVAVVVHAAAVTWSVTARRVPRVESARRSAALVSVLTMGVMALVY